MNTGFNQTTGQKDITGNKYNFLTALSFSHKVGKFNYFWVFECECGVKKTINKSAVIRNSIKSCGCQKSRLNGDTHRKHGMSRTRFYKTWRSMLERCLDENNSNYADYGGRGIRVEKSWLNFENFKKDMLESYAIHCEDFSVKNTTLDRIDNNGDYCKQNCRWASYTQQANNRRNNVYLTYRGETKTLSQWAKSLNIPISTITNRIIAGKSVEHILISNKK